MKEYVTISTLSSCDDNGSILNKKFKAVGHRKADDNSYFKGQVNDVGKCELSTGMYLLDIDGEKGAETRSEWFFSSDVICTWVGDEDIFFEDEGIPHIYDNNSLNQTGAFDPEVCCWVRNYHLTRGDSIKIFEDVPGDGGQMTLWHGCLTMCKYLEGVVSTFRCKVDKEIPPIRSIFPENNGLKNLSVIELGSGCGLMAMVIERLGAELVVATEQDSCIPYLEKNLRANEYINSCNNNNNLKKAIYIDTLSWGEDKDVQKILQSTNKQSFDLILGCEITYNVKLYEQLLKTMNQLMNTDSLAILTHNFESTPSGGKYYKNFLEMAKANFLVNEIDYKDLVEEGFQSETVVIITLKKRPIVNE